MAGTIGPSFLLDAPMREPLRDGFALLEVVVAALMISIAASAILGAYVSQVTLNEHARNLSLAVQDANRVIERIRQQNVGCTTPAVASPVGTNWDAWLADTSAAGGGGRSLPLTGANELVVVTCQSQGTLAYCGDANQVGTGEWARLAGTTTNYNPLRVTAAVCWRERGRVIGECTWNGAALVPDQNVAVSPDTANIIDSPAMLTTVVTCR